MKLSATETLFGARMRERRLLCALRQVDLAAQLQVHQVHISRWEAGKDFQRMTPARLRRLAPLLKTTADYLLGLTDDPEARA